MDKMDLKDYLDFKTENDRFNIFFLGLVIGLFILALIILAGMGLIPQAVPKTCIPNDFLAILIG